jgi:hypothetical protein
MAVPSDLSRVVAAYVEKGKKAAAAGEGRKEGRKSN